VKKAIYHILVYIHWFFLGSLGLSYLSVLVSPEVCWPLAFFGLAYPVFLAINLAFLFFWAIRRQLLFFSSFIIILAGWNYHQSFFRISFRESTVPQDKNGIKVLSYNVRMFNYYSWEESPQTLEEILRFILSQNAGVLCFQEFYYSGNSDFSQQNITGTLGKERYMHLTPEGKRSEDLYAGLATFSSLPIINQASIVFPNTRNICIYTDVLWNGDTVRIYNNHLQSISLRKSNRRFIKNFDPLGDDENLEKLKDISFRLKHAFVERAKQARIISEHIRKCPYPVIVCGDFNDTPISYAYFQMKKGLTDAFTGSGEGFGNTYRGNFPSYRIDYILHSKDLQSVRFQRHRVPLSDHYPVSCVIHKADE